MKRKYFFSLIELMTVILVILLLISLLLPTFLTLKMKARSALCKNQMRQLSVLFTNYVSDNNGLLPDDLSTDFKGFVKDPASFKNCNFYRYWQGHLLPYFENGLKSYNKAAKIRKDGQVFMYDYFNGKWPGVGTTQPDDLLDPSGWSVIYDAAYKGGFNDLKTYICPEIFTSTYDINVSTTFNALKIPRISNLTSRDGFINMSTLSITNNGLPTTYLANEVFFGFDGPGGARNSLRLDEITSYDKKAILIEGGLCWAGGTNGEPEYSYYRLGAGDLGANGSALQMGLTKTSTAYQKISFVHDEQNPFWLANCAQPSYFPFLGSSTLTKDQRFEIATKFNLNFAGKAYMIQGDAGYTIVSYMDPATLAFDSFFKANNATMAAPTFVLFYEPEFHYLTGKMNVLFGDGSVETKDQSWLSMNRLSIGALSKD